MKKIILLFTILLFACGKKQTNTILKLDKNERSKYKIKSIDSVKNVYIIYAKKSDSLFKIVSFKTELNDCKKIEKGKSYHFELKTAFIDKKSLPLDISGLNYHDVTIRLEGDSITDIYTSENLNGLCYVK